MVKEDRWEFRAAEVVTISTVRELKMLLKKHGCQIFVACMNLQVQPSPYVPKRIVPNNDNRTLLEYGLTDPEVVYRIHMYRSKAPVPERDPPGSMGYELLLKMMNGTYAGKDILLRGLGSRYTVDRVMELLQVKCEILTIHQDWRLSVENYDSPLQNYTMRDGD
jgi:hypothetical protein